MAWNQMEPNVNRWLGFKVVPKIHLPFMEQFFSLQNDHAGAPHLLTLCSLKACRQALHDLQKTFCVLCVEKCMNGTISC